VSSTLLRGHACIVLDACCIINLYESGYCEAILKATGPCVTVVSVVLEQELGTRDLQPLIERGILQIVEPESDAEFISFVNFAVQLDDGEALTGAVARHRRWAIATDERKARKVFTREIRDILLVSTPELLKHWVDTSRPRASSIRDALTNIRTRARYEPGKDHALYRWWQSYFKM
jgi:hypothetical protein